MPNSNHSTPTISPGNNRNSFPAISPGNNSNTVPRNAVPAFSPENNRNAVSTFSPGNNRNAVLAMLPRRDFSRLLPHLEPMTFGFMEMLYEPWEPMHYLYFLQQGVASIVAPMENGSEVEVGMIGAEGVVGASLLMGVDRSPHRTFIQLPGTGHRIKSDVLINQFRQSSKLQECLMRAMHAYSTQVHQTAACNRVHSVEERLARWLLMSHDRMGSHNGNPPVPITHELMARMLGARRSTVTIFAGILQRANFIQYQRGLVHILDRKGLEGVACECYDTVRSESDRLMRIDGDGSL